MEFIERSSLSESEKLEIFELWNNEYPENLFYKSKEEFDEYLKNLTDQSHILMVDNNGKVKGWYFDFKRDNAKWFAIILDSSVQGKGFGTKILERIKRRERELNGWVIDHNIYKKINGDSYISPLHFYLKNGFQELKTDRLELDKLSAVKIRWRKTNHAQ